jgi:hypothetical protein
MTTQEAIMTTQEIADRFYELSQQGDWNKIQDELFAVEAVSIEPDKGPTTGLRNAEGLTAIRQKAIDFQNMVEAIHGGFSSKPLVAGNHFAVAMGMDATMKGMGRSNMDEIAVYEVKNGKIVKEQFFF